MHSKVRVPAEKSQERSLCEAAEVKFKLQCLSQLEMSESWDIVKIPGGSSSRENPCLLQEDKCRCRFIGAQCVSVCNGDGPPHC